MFVRRMFGIFDKISVSLLKIDETIKEESYCFCSINIKQDTISVWFNATDIKLEVLKPYGEVYKDSISYQKTASETIVKLISNTVRKITRNGSKN